MSNQNNLPTGWQILCDKHGNKKGYLDEKHIFHEELPQDEMSKLQQTVSRLQSKIDELQRLNATAWFKGTLRYSNGTVITVLDNKTVLWELGGTATKYEYSIHSNSVIVKHPQIDNCTIFTHNGTSMVSVQGKLLAW
mmetsp:Transcript_15075/g.21047  ORF Transcript_15075/g.21047 Transcript_15075/m.21047 type:complete len:137 (-) Transcript_15075:104-514(-)